MFDVQAFAVCERIYLQDLSLLSGYPFAVTSVTGQAYQASISKVDSLQLIANSQTAALTKIPPPKLTAYNL